MTNFIQDTNVVRFALSSDSDGKPTAVYVKGGAIDAVDMGHLRGSYLVDMSDAQYGKLMRLVHQGADGAEIPFVVRWHGKGVRICQF